jgi:glycosyltransferase involved in cell wall biosynthesis
LIDPDNPWFSERTHIVREFKPYAADVLVISGLGWDRFIPDDLKMDLRIPIIYLVQNAFKAYTPPYCEHLAFKAIRISVSPHITETFRRRAAKVNGPVFTIPNAIDISDLPRPLFGHSKDIDVLILGLKNKPLAQNLYARLLTSGKRIVVLTELTPRKDFLHLLATAHIVACLPTPDEGFYLPALEAMYFGAITICPDVGGNRHFCHDKENCFVPLIYQLDDILAAVESAINMSPHESARMCLAARLTALANTHERERSQFLEILDHVKDLL